MPVQFGKRHRGEPGHTQFGTGTATGKKTPGGAGTHTGRTGHTGARGHTDHTDEPHSGSGTHVGRCGLAAGFFQGTDISRLCDVTVGVSRSYKGRGRPRLQ